MKWRTENDRQLGRVMDSLQMQLRDEANNMLVIWEKTLRLHVKPKPVFFPDWAWAFLLSLVIQQSSQEEFLKGSQPIPEEVLNVGPEKTKDDARRNG